MTKGLLSAVALCAALACVAGVAPARAPQDAAHGAQGAPAPKPAPKPAPGPHGGAKSGGGGAKSAGGEASAAALPKVTVIKEADLKSLLGAGAGRARPLLVNFWATWCGPCREEFPDLVEIRGQYGTDKLDFVLVSLDDPADVDKAVPEFLAEARASAFPAYLLHADDDSAAINLVDPTWSGELPATFLYDRAGSLVFQRKGRVRVPELRAALDRALAAKPPEAGAQK